MTQDRTLQSLAGKGMLTDPGDHFAGRFEVERKYRVDGLSEIRARLIALNAEAFTLGNTESDHFFDFPDGRLAANDQIQTLRHMRPSGRVLWISKGPGPDRCVAMDLDDFDKAVAMLTSLGFVGTGRITKSRDIYFLGAFHLTLDDVPGLGTFVELAAMTDDEAALPGLEAGLVALAGRLGLAEHPPETLSYREMMARIGGQAGDL